MLLGDTRAYSIDLNSVNIRSKIWRRCLTWLSLLLHRFNLYSPQHWCGNWIKYLVIKMLFMKVKSSQSFFSFSVLRFFQGGWLRIKRLTNYALKSFAFLLTMILWREVPFSFKFQNIPHCYKKSIRFIAIWN